jgi:hypothetical protein
MSDYRVTLTLNEIEDLLSLLEDGIDAVFEDPEDRARLLDLQRKLEQIRYSF